MKLFHFPYSCKEVVAYWHICILIPSKLGEFNSDQNYFAKKIRKSGKPQKNII